MEPVIEAAFLRAAAGIPEDESGLEPTDLSAADVLEIHFRIADGFYREGWEIGRIGPRDPGLLLSAVGRQCVSFGGVKKWDDLCSRCATLFFGLIRSHPFHDANKRTAFLCALWQLQRGGRAPTVAPETFEDLTVRVAGHALNIDDGHPQLAASGDPDVEVMAIARNFAAWTKPAEPLATAGYRGGEIAELIDAYRSSLVRLADR